MIVRILPLLVLGLTSARAERTLYLHSCGLYKMTGRVHCSRNAVLGGCSITIYPESTARTTLAVANAYERLRAYDGAVIALKARVTALDSEAPIEIVRENEILSTDATNDASQVLLLEKAPCASE